MYTGTMQHNLHMQPSPAVNVAGSAGRVGMSPGSYHGAGPGHYATNMPQHYPTNHAPHHQISGPMYRSTDVYGRPMAHGGSPGNMSSAYESRPDPMYNQMYAQQRPVGYSGPMYPPTNAVVPHPRADGYPQGSGSMHSGQFMYSTSQMPPSSLNYSIATSGDPTPTQPTLQSSSGQQAAPVTAGSQATAGPQGSAYSLPASSHLSPAAQVSGVVHNSVDNSWSNVAQSVQPGSAPSTASSTSAPTGTSNPPEVPSSLANNVPPSSVTAEGMNLVNQTDPASSAPSTAPPPGSVPQRTPMQQVGTLGAGTLAVSQVKPVSNIAGQTMPPMGGALQQAPPASAPGEAFPPQGSQQQQQSFMRMPGPSLMRSEVSVIVGCQDLWNRILNVMLSLWFAV